MGCNGSRPKLNDVFSPLLAEFFFGNCKSGPPPGQGRQKNTITNYVVVQRFRTLYSLFSLSSLVSFNLYYVTLNDSSSASLLSH